MIIPKEIEDKMAQDPNLDSMVKTFPVTFFGSMIHYPKQAHIIKTWLEVRPKITVITGWKRCCKTAAAAYLGTCWGMGQLDKNWLGARAMGITESYQWTRKFQNVRQGIIAGHSLDHIEQVLLPMYQSLIPPGMVKNWFSKTNKRIELVKKTRFLIRTYEQSLEEWKSGVSQFTHLDEEPPWEVMQEILERSRTVEGKILITVALDDADTSWLPDACKNPKKIFGTDSFLHFKLGVEDVPEKIYPQSEKLIVYNQYDGTPLEKAVRRGDFASVAGKWWHCYDPAVHPIKPFKIPAEWPKYRAIDPGISAPCACVWGAVHPAGHIIIYREYYKTNTTIAQRCKDIIEMSGNTRRREQGIWWEVENSERYELTLMDHSEFRKDEHTGDGLDQAYVQEGIAAMPCTTLGQEARREIVNKWLWVDKRQKHFITHEKGAPKIYIFDTCINLLAEAERKNVKVSLNARSSIMEKKIQNSWDHAMDCVESIVCDLHWMLDGYEIVR